MVAFQKCNLSLVLSFLHGFLQAACCQTLIGPKSVTVEKGADTTLTCLVINGDDDTAESFMWSDVSQGTKIVIFNGGMKVSPLPKYDDFSVEEDTTSSVLTIRGTEITDEGSYLCESLEAENYVPFAEVTVEVMSKLELTSDTTYLVVGTQYTATCSATGGRPQELIEWYLDGEQQLYQDIEQYTYPNSENYWLSDTVSRFSFTPVKENNGQSLECRTTGHQLTSLNQDTNITSLNVVFPPDDSIIIVNFIEDGTYLKITCYIQPGQQPNPRIEDLWIYKNYSVDPYQTPMASPLIEPTPDHITKYTCTGENSLGNTSTAKLFIPCLFPSESASCSNSGLVVGISILAILLVGSLTINVALYVRMTRQSASKGWLMLDVSKDSHNY
ncbi:nectin 1a-like [Diadema setosum]|uniref:nectin 1a-like n=1 Tax=Diadema setosum TaxID=31175 RepID=UPI003B3B21EF